MNFPEIGTQWTNGQIVARVVGADKRGIKLVSDEGFQVVPSYEWPGDFVPVMAETEPQGMIRACLVGGAEGEHFIRILDIAAKQGVDIATHIPGDKKFGGIPDHTDLVICLISHISHGVFDLSKAVCKARSIPVALAPSAGFGPALSKELDRLGIRRDGYGGLSTEGSRSTWMTWNGRTWVSTDRPATSSTSAGDLLATGTFFGVLGALFLRGAR